MERMSQQAKSRVYDEDPELSQWIKESQELEAHEEMRERYYEQRHKLRTSLYASPLSSVPGAVK